jgi:hypothetical protein
MKEKAEKNPTAYATVFIDDANRHMKRVQKLVNISERMVLEKLDETQIPKLVKLMDATDLIDSGLKEWGEKLSYCSLTQKRKKKPTDSSR